MTAAARAPAHRRVVVGVDLSRASEVAANHALDLARRTDAEVVLAMVTEQPLAAIEADTPQVRARTEILSHRIAEDRRRLALFRARRLGQGVALSQAIVDGYAVDLLPAIAADLGAEAIVIGAHDPDRWLLDLGSTAEGVVRRASQTVLVARGPAPHGGYRRVIVGVDFTEISDAAARAAGRLVAPDGRIELVHCWHDSMWLELRCYLEMDRDRVIAEHLAELEQAGRRLAVRTQLRSHRDAAFHLVEAAPIDGLTQRAAETDADLVVVGTHGRRGLRGLGSVARRLIRGAPCSVAVARRPA